MIRKSFYCFTCIFIILCLSPPCTGQGSRPPSGGYQIPAKEVDPHFRSSPAANITKEDVDRLRKALIKEADPIFGSHPANQLTQEDVENLKTGVFPFPEHPVNGARAVGRSGWVCEYQRLRLWGPTQGIWRSSVYPDDDRMCREPSGTNPPRFEDMPFTKSTGDGYVTLEHVILAWGSHAGVMPVEIILTGMNGMGEFIGVGEIYSYPSPDSPHQYKGKMQITAEKMADGAYMLYPSGSGFWRNRLNRIYVRPDRYGIRAVITDREGNRVARELPVIFTLFP